ncbi:hypothetical protein HDV00_010197 [Rhizophlyctis rosea]|nr:hypothetical protein HDV00_010197 [Rhizophlyctis rosea]
MTTPTSTTPSHPTAKPAILVLGGAFNPAHTQHTTLLTHTKTHLLTTHSHRWSQILGAYLAIAPDGYVRKKCASTSQKAMKFPHRAALSQILTSADPWLSQSPFQEIAQKPMGSAGELGRQLRAAFAHHYEIDIDIIIVLGADRATTRKGSTYKWRKPSSQPHVYTAVVGRDSVTSQLRASWNSDMKAGLIPSPEHTVILEEAVQPVSSTLVRRVLEKVHEEGDVERKKVVGRGVVESGWLVERQLEYVLENEGDLYM